MPPTGLAKDMNQLLRGHYVIAAGTIHFPNSFAHIDDSGFYRNILTDIEEHLCDLLAMKVALHEEVVCQKLRSNGYFPKDIRDMKQEFNRIGLALSKVREAISQALIANRMELDGLYLNNHWRGVVKEQRDIIRESSDKALRHFLAFIM
jgi:hypothetical protein